MRMLIAIIAAFGAVILLSSHTIYVHFYEFIPATQRFTAAARTGDWQAMNTALEDEYRARDKEGLLWLLTNEKGDHR